MCWRVENTSQGSRDREFPHQTPAKCGFQELNFLLADATLVDDAKHVVSENLDLSIADSVYLVLEIASSSRSRKFDREDLRRIRPQRPPL